MPHFGDLLLETDLPGIQLEHLDAVEDLGHYLDSSVLLLHLMQLQATLAIICTGHTPSVIPGRWIQLSKEQDYFQPKNAATSCC